MMTGLAVDIQEARLSEVSMMTMPASLCSLTSASCILMHIRLRILPVSVDNVARTMEENLGFYAQHRETPYMPANLDAQ